ncbi:MAG: DUF2299 domain-containing protein [Candidatus Methanoperedens sp.]|jgi:hypothetical protein|nr:MAG: DUF2299 domain-containing protein [Candidatus Methanoperedens sp.]
MGQKEIDTMSRKIKEWLSEDGMYKDKLADDKAYFHFIVEIPQGSGRIIDIIQPKNRDDLIIVGNGLMISPEHLEKLREMDETEKAEFLWDIKFGLLFRESSFQIIPEGNNPERVQFTREIYYDGLNKNKLMESLRENFRCNLFVIWKFNKQFGEIVSGSEPAGPMFG